MHPIEASIKMSATITNGSRSNPENLPVQTRMTPFQIAALKAIASLDGINSAALLRRLVDQCIEYNLLDAPVQDRELVLGLLKRGGFDEDLQKILDVAVFRQSAREAAEESAREAEALAGRSILAGVDARRKKQGSA